VPIQFERDHKTRHASTRFFYVLRLPGFGSALNKCPRHALAMIPMAISRAKSRCFGSI
jgi:hypothetical protein